ncbi:MAG: hypothetical protein OXG55_15160 [bacterium]|nr:hypothetical protein [bacterium]MCY4104576.1 hypothetical protein [bacterium]
MKDMNPREDRAAALERWAERVQPETLRRAEPQALEVIAELAALRDRTNHELATLVAKAREAGFSWSQIGAELGVSKQAAQQKYGTRSSERSLGGIDP